MPMSVTLGGQSSAGSVAGMDPDSIGGSMFWWRARFASALTLSQQKAAPMTTRATDRIDIFHTVRGSMIASGANLQHAKCQPAATRAGARDRERTFRTL
jgi:hypothetical protein